jgi:hypothetical protein
MRTILLTAVLGASLLGCGGDDDEQAATVQLTGVVLDPDAFFLARFFQGASPDEAFASALKADVVVALDSDESVSATTNAEGQFTLEVPADTSFRLVTSRDGYVHTLNNGVVVTTREDMSDVTAFVCPSGPQSATGLLAGVVGLTEDDLVANGALVAGASSSTAPDAELVTDATAEVATDGVQLFGFNADGTAMVPATDGTSVSTFGWTAYKPDLAADLAVTLQVTDPAGALQFDPYTCVMRPGFFTYCSDGIYPRP